MSFTIIGREVPSIDQRGLQFEIKGTKEKSSKRSVDWIFKISFSMQY
jgi:hypothetical protein